MMSHACLILLGLALLLGASHASEEQGYSENERQFHNEWAVEVRGGERTARDVAKEYGFKFIRQIGTLDNMYSFVKEDHHLRSRREAVDITGVLEEDKRVSWVQQQETHYHDKRDAQAVSQDATGDDYVPPFNDPKFPQQWYLHNNGQNKATPGVDMNLAPAWKLGIMGKGVVVSIVDDGMDGTHPDLKPNYDPAASWDFNGDDSDPHPDDSEEAGIRNNHGTRCAGEVAAVANNSICGVGAAPEASIGGIRFLDGTVTDSMEASALTYANQHIDIYSCCWGPSDNGKTMRAPGPLMTAALEKGTREGRGGKGSIYMWASGNGGHNYDDCGADAYVGNIHTISVGSINDKGESVYFMEKCPSTMAVVLSGGLSDQSTASDFERRQNLVITTDIHDQCIDNFIGTSSAAPLAAGLVALVLQANPNLTWRDVQHIIANGALIPNSQETTGWHVNGAGFHVNEKFGFGMLDAGRMVELALTWEPVPPQKTCQVSQSKEYKDIPQGSSLSIHVDVDCSDSGIVKLEHVVVTVSFQHRRRGDVSIDLTSPSGTPSELLSTRRYDNSSSDVVNFPFMTVKNWGENPNGRWRLRIVYHHTPAEVKPKPKFPDIPRQSDNVARVQDFTFTFYGTGPTTDNGGTSGSEEANPAINPELKGSLKPQEVIGIFNSEQKDDEEIVVEEDDLGKGVHAPPNTKHNLDKDGEGIDTGRFDGILADPKIRSLIHEIYEHERAMELHLLTAKRNKDITTSRACCGEEERSPDVRSRDQERSHDHERSHGHQKSEEEEPFIDLFNEDDY